jgi:peroxiredoxin
VKLVAVSVDAPQRSREVVKRWGLPFPILADERRSVTRGLGLLHRGGGLEGSDISLPAHVLIDSERRIRWRYVADRIQNRLATEHVLDHIRAEIANEP